METTNATRRQRTKLGIRGFTTVEILTALAILSILISVMAVNVIQMRRPLKQTELDTVAKEIYVAAQNHLTMAKSQNLIDGRQNKNESGEKVGWGLAGTTSLDAQGEYFFVYSANDPDDSSSVLNLMLPYASIDETVRKGSSNYLIRYQPSSGRVLDVFHNDGGEFPHAIGASEYDALMAVSDRDGGDHKKDRARFGEDEGVIGYYSGDDLLKYDDKNRGPQAICQQRRKA